MDAVKFVEECRRMFAVSGENQKHSLFNMNTRAEDVVKEVEEWSAAHPRKTRQSEFLKQWPEAKVDKDGLLSICPSTLSASHRGPSGVCTDPNKWCEDCYREFWMQEVE